MFVDGRIKGLSGLLKLLVGGRRVFLAFCDCLLTVVGVFGGVWVVFVLLGGRKSRGYNLRGRGCSFALSR